MTLYRVTTITGKTHTIDALGVRDIPGYQFVEFINDCMVVASFNRSHIVSIVQASAERVVPPAATDEKEPVNELLLDIKRGAQQIADEKEQNDA